MTEHDSTSNNSDNPNTAGSGPSSEETLFVTEATSRGAGRDVRPGPGETVTLPIEVIDTDTRLALDGAHVRVAGDGTVTIQYRDGGRLILEPASGIAVERPDPGELIEYPLVSITQILGDQFTGANLAIDEGGRLGIVFNDGGRIFFRDSQAYTEALQGIGERGGTSLGNVLQSVVRLHVISRLFPQERQEEEEPADQEAQFLTEYDPGALPPGVDHLDGLGDESALTGHAGNIEEVEGEEEEEDRDEEDGSRGDPAAEDDILTTPEDTRLTANILANDSDPEGKPLRIIGHSAPAHGTLVLDPDTGEIIYDPDPDYYGPDGFTYTIVDSEGGTSSATVTITVTPVNDPPVAADDMAVTEETTPVVIPVLANDTDIDGGPLTITDVSAPANGTAQITDGGTTITYTADRGHTGDDSFSYTISDGRGGTSSATVQVTVNAASNEAEEFTLASATVTDPGDPEAVNDIAVTDEDVAVTIPVLNNDADPGGDALTVTGVSAPGNGTAVIAGGGTAVTYTPNPDYNGPDSFTYTISDAAGGVSTATVDITVNPVNDAPQALDDAATGQEDIPISLSVLDNDTDADGDALALAGLSSPANGSVEPSADGTALVYTPDPDFHGTDSFTYTITDNDGASASATVEIEVAPVNDDPVAVDDSGTTVRNASLTIPVLSNDFDLDGDALTIIGQDGNTQGKVQIGPGSGALTYIPETDFLGTDAFAYTISDGRGGVAQANVTIEVADDLTAVAGTAADAVDEAGLPGGTDPAAQTSVTGQVALDFGADQSVAQVTELRLFAADGESLAPLTLTSRSRPVTLGQSASPDGARQITAAIAEGPDAGATVFTFSLSRDGDYDFTLRQPLDHPDIGQTGADDTLLLSFGFSATDGMQIADGSIEIRVADDGPVAVDNLVSVDEGGLADGFGYAIGGTNPASLWKINTSDGTAEDIGPVSVAGDTTIDVEAAALSPGGSILYAVAEGLRGNAAKLVAIDVNTAETTVIADAPARSNGAGASFGPDGTLYWSAGDDFYAVEIQGGPDSPTGGATFTLMNSSPALPELSSLAINAEGVAFGVSMEGSRFGLYSVDPADGGRSFVGWLNLPSNAKPEGLSFDSRGQLWMLERVSGHLHKINTLDATFMGTALTVGSQTSDGFESFAMAAFAQPHGRVAGNILSDPSGTAVSPDTDRPGADDAIEISSIKINGITYSYDPLNDRITNDQTGDVIAGSMLEADTGLSGRLLFHFDDGGGAFAGDYVYVSPNVGADRTETFDYVIADGEGDLDGAVLSIAVKDIAPAGIGDADGDGQDDWIIGDPSSGQYYVVFEPTDPVSVDLSKFGASSDGFVLSGIRIADAEGSIVITDPDQSDIEEAAAFFRSADSTSGESYILFGPSGDGGDFLLGSDANDQISGTAGHDTILSGAGDDMMTGGPGSDRFTITPSDLGGGDRITDFQAGAGGDVLLVQDVFDGFDPAVSALREYVTLADDGTDTRVQIDTDGAGEASHFADAVVLEGVSGVTLNDLLQDDNIQVD